MEQIEAIARRRDLEQRSENLWEHETKEVAIYLEGETWKLEVEGEARTLDLDLKYPDVRIGIVGKSGNAFAILGSVDRGLKSAGVSQQERDIYKADATDGDYDHLLATTMKYVDVY
ncbi:MAG: hypothetical protein CMJ75_18725 [Planctomycetaceae bacterium]|nr:hypothetical protein [Planctomycetaceae bacterium]